MADILSELVVEITSDAKQLRKGLDDAGNDVKSWVNDNEKQFKAVGVALTGLGATITASFGMAAKAAVEEKVNIAQLAQTLKNVGVSYDDVKESLEGVITATQKKTGIADSQQREALSRLVLVTNNYDKALSLLPTALDLAAAGQIDVTTAARLLGRVMEGDTEALSRYGIKVKEGATATEALAQIQERVAGSAEAMANPFNIIKAQMSDVAEKIGGILLPVLDKLVQIIIPITDKIQAWVDKNPELAKNIMLVVGVIGILATVLGPLLIMLPFLVTGFTLLLGPIGLVAAAIIGLAAVVTLIIANWTPITGFFQNLWDNITGIFHTWVSNIKQFLMSINPWEWIKQGWENLREGIKSVLDNIFGHSDVEDWIGGLKTYLSGIDLSEEGKTMFGSFRTAANGQLSSLAQDIEAARAAITGTTGAAREGAILNYQYSKWVSEKGSEEANRVFGRGPLEMQHGGIVTRPTLGLVGEAGPEAIIPLDRMGREVNIFVELDGKTIARAIGLPLVEEIRARTGLK